MNERSFIGKLVASLFMPLVCLAFVSTTAAGTEDEKAADEAADEEEEAAAPTSVPAVILPIELKKLAEEFGAMQRETMRMELTAIGIFTLESEEAILPELERLKTKNILTPGCLDDKRCIQKVGQALEASVLFHLSAAKSVGGVKFTVRSFSVTSGHLVRKASDFAEGEAREIERAVRWLTRKVSSPMITALAKGKGTLLIESVEPDVEIFINQKPFGKKAGKRFKVSSGVFDVQVTKEGFFPFHDLVVVRPGQLQVVRAMMRVDPESERGKWLDMMKNLRGGKSPGGDLRTRRRKSYLPDGTEPPKPPETKFYKTWWFWTVIGVGVAAAGGLTAYFLWPEPPECSGTG